MAIKTGWPNSGYPVFYNVGKGGFENVLRFGCFGMYGSNVCFGKMFLLAVPWAGVDSAIGNYWRYLVWII